MSGLSAVPDPFPDRQEVGVCCGQCGSGEVYFVACPKHEWAIASICHGCHNVYVIGDGECRECGWRGEV